MFEWWHFSLLFLTGMAAGFVDSIAGGGGLITLPVLLNLGLDPQTALGTNKLQAVFGSGSAAAHYAHAKTVDLRDSLRGFVFSLIGAALGAVAVQHVEASVLRRIIPILLASIALYMLVRPRLGDRDVHPRMPRGAFDVLFGLGIGFYDGFFGPGTGTFWTMAFVLLLGFNLTRATGYTKVMNFGSNLSSLVFFLAARKAVFGAGLVMGIGQLLGARIGSRMVVRKGTGFIRPVFILMALALTAKLVYQGFSR